MISARVPHLDLKMADCNTLITDLRDRGQLDKKVMPGVLAAVDFSFSRLIGAIPPRILRALTLRFDRSPFDTLDKLCEFVQTRSAYVAQTALYGYLKTRMGTKYRILFEDETFSKSINHAKWRVYASCLCDLSVFASATSCTDDRFNQEDYSKLALFLLKRAIEETFDDVDDPELKEQTIAELEARMASIDWQSAAQGENAFQKSPGDLIDLAPVSDEFKELDREIVTNSVRFRWRDVREQLRKRIDAGKISTEWFAKRH